MAKKTLTAAALTYVAALATSLAQAAASGADFLEEETAMIDKRPTTPRGVAAFSLFSMAEEAAWSDGALHHYLSRAGLDSRDAALASRLTTTARCRTKFYWTGTCGTSQACG